MTLNSFDEPPPRVTIMREIPVMAVPVDGMDTDADMVADLAEKMTWLGSSGTGSCVSVTGLTDKLIVKLDLGTVPISTLRASKRYLL